MTDATLTPETACVYDYRTGSMLAGTPTQDLIDASAAEAESSGTGAVGAYHDAGLWHYLREDEMGAEGARVVYIAE